MKPRAPRKLRKRHVQGDLRAVVDETIGLFHRLRWVAERIYGEPGKSEPRRGVLRGLARFGAQSVPALAKARSLRRQSVQEVVDALAAEGLVELVDNPRHARSRLVRVTARGAALVAAWDRVDGQVLAAIGAGLDREALAVTARTLAELRARFETDARWRPAAARAST